MLDVFAKMGSVHHRIQISQLFEGRDPKKLKEKWTVSAKVSPKP